MSGSSTTLTNREQRLSDIRVQTSTQGTVLPKGWGRYRTNCNLIWYGGFEAIEHRSVVEQGGKGGGGGGVTQETITYTYQAAVAIMLGHGPINGVTTAWRGKVRLDGEPIGSSRRTLRHTVTVGVLEAGDTFSVAVPQAASVVGDAGVIRVSDRANDGRRRVWSRLQRGTQYTRAGGTYTFTSDTPAGTYEITYQVQVAAADVTALGRLGMGLIHGTLDQAPWAWLEAVSPAQALSYPGMAYLVSSAYQLTSDAQIHNHNFEISTGTELGFLPGRSVPVLDADPALIVRDVLLDETWGAGWDASRVTGLDRYSQYCIANGIWLSPVMSEQASAAEWLERLLQLTNTNVVWDGESLEFVPLGDEAITANGVTFTPQVDPVVDLGPDHFMAATGQPANRVVRHRGAPGSSEAIEGDDVGYNIWTLEIENRANGYATEPVSYEDTAHISVHGRRQKPTIKAAAIKDPNVGAQVAAVLCQAELAQRNVYEFSLPWTMGWLRPLQIVTITEPALGLDRKPVRLLTIDEDGRDFKVTAMEADIGIASAPLYGTQGGLGFVVDYNASPGDVAAPVIFEPPVELAGDTGLAIWVAATGQTSMWGGAEVWVSMDDGINYRRMGELRGGSRYGALTAALGTAGSAVMSVALSGRGGQMFSGTEQDAQVLNTLLYVRAANGSNPEFLSYQTATLTGTNAYNLSGLQRGAYESRIQAKAVGAPFVRVDDMVFKGEPLPLSMVGRTLKVKLLSFNVFGTATQALEDATEYTYLVTGDMVKLPPANVTSFTISVQGDGTRQFDWSWGGARKPADLRGYVVRFRQGDGPFTWEQMSPFASDDGFHTASPIESNQLLAGPYVFAIKTLDNYGILSTEALYIDAVLPDPRLGNSIDYIDEGAIGWPGVMTDAVMDVLDGDVVVRAADQATWDTLPTTWDAYTRWVWDPVTSLVYETQPMDFGIVVPVLPVGIYLVDGQAVFEVAVSSDGVTWGPWQAAASPITTRYIKGRLSVSLPSGVPVGPGVTPIITIRKFVMNYVGKVSSETSNDTLTSTYPNRTGPGDVRLPVTKSWVRMNRISVTLQNVGAGWSWTLIDKDGVNGPRIKIFNGSGALADALIDWTIEGIAT